MGFLFALGALVCGLALLFGIALGDLTPHLVGLGITLLALALLIGPAVARVGTWRR
jgi:hypothetical protein